MSIAACLTAHALNIGYGPIVKKGVEALDRDRISHENQTNLGAETYSPGNAWLITDTTSGYYRVSAERKRNAVKRVMPLQVTVSGARLAPAR